MVPFRSALVPGLLFLLAAAGVRPTAAQEAVLIGLVVPADGPLRDVGAAVERGVDLALREANADGGLHGRPFALEVVRPEGLWGQGLSRVVSLSFDEPVWAVLGGLGGRSAHLIQQVITKARGPFVTPWASDPTLTRAMVPWFFQAMPDDRQQADVMLDDAVARGFSDLRVVADTGYDSRQLAAALGRAANTRGLGIRVFSPGTLLQALAGGQSSTSARLGEAAIFLTDTGTSPLLLGRLGELQAPPRVYVPLGMAGSEFPELAAYPGPLGVPMPDLAVPAGLEWLGGDLPAAFGYDAARTVIEAIRAAGLDHTRIRDALASYGGTGVTGAIGFDALGRRTVVLRVRRPKGPPTRVGRSEPCTLRSSRHRTT